MNKALIVLSGGQDSATCLAWSLDKFDEIYTISFDYGQRHKIELDCAKKLSELACSRSHIELPVMSLKHLGNSALLNTSKIDSCHANDKDLPASFVPARNMLFLTLAGAKAYQLGIKNLVTGVCQTDYSGYPDCRDLSIKAVSVGLSLCMNFDFDIHTPLMWKTKAETVLMMKNLGKLDWYKNTHTCYEGQKPPCLKCPSCLLRQKGFEEVGIADPLLED